MDATRQNHNPNPREKANCLSTLLFTYTLPLFRKGYSKDLDVDDLYDPLLVDRSQHLGDRLERVWLKQVETCKGKEKKPSLLKTLLFTFWPEYLYLAFLEFFGDVILRLATPIVLGNLLTYFDAVSTTTKSDALIYASVLITINVLTCFSMNQYMLGSFHYGMRVRAACCSIIYRKAMKLSQSAFGDTSSGKIVNLLSNDVSRFDLVSLFINSMWSSPVIAIASMFFIFNKAGIAGIIGMAPVFIVTILQGYNGKLSSVYRKKTAMRTDERVRLMDEIVSGIQVIKMYAWEKPFTKLINFARRKELNVILKSSYVRAVYMTFNLFTTRAALYCTLLTMVLMHQKITAATVFVLMTYYNILASTVSAMFVRGISEIAELLVAIKRLENFLLSDEYVINRPFPDEDISEKMDKDTKLLMKSVTSKWDIASSEDTLKDISITLRKGELLGVIGLVGSGKSSLLETILGEVVVTSGTKILNGTVSYASQEPWVFGASVRQNILFGSEYDKKKYNEVVRVCSLEKDFQQFPEGDLTLVGDRGTSLSGGQKARINLARAIYRDADLYLLDDPLSAVDIHVSKHLYEECINGYLRRKARILVTHQVYYLKNADDIIILENGSVAGQGTFHQLAQLDNEYAKLLATNEAETKTRNISEAEGRTRTLSEAQKLSRSISFPRQLSIASTLSEMSLTGSLLSENLDDELEHRNLKDLQEESSKGKVEGSLFWKYITAGTNFCVVYLLIVLMLSTQAFASGIDYFVSFWVNVEEARNINVVSEMQTKILNFPIEWTTELCVYFAGILVVSLLVIGLFRSLLYYSIAMWASQQLHDNMFVRVVQSPMKFFDTNPSGRILNRFAKDLGSIDEILPKVILDSSQILLNIVGSMVLVAVVNPYFLIMVFIGSLILMIMRNIFLKSSKSIKRLEGIMRGPVFGHLGASLNGLTTIRAFNAQGIVADDFDKHQDYHTGAWFMYVTVSSAYGFWIDFICLIFTGLVTFSFMTFGSEFGLEVGEVGLAITQSMSVTGMVQWGMRQSAEITNNLLSVERVLEYDNLEPEVQPKKPIKVSNIWPEKGHIKFKDMSLRYREDTPLVLKNLNLVINPREKVGIVGRTGAGKSSLISALFRLGFIEGHVEIDEIDTKELLLQTLRSKISIIPQDPVLFSGTLRYNLDPFEEYDDNVLYKAINEVELKDPANVMNRLENRVMDRGSNYSVGQRQLICLARALVRNNKILMLDEATANVDPQTDVLIQKTIRSKFEDCTVLTVAHRLNTIMDSDKVLVMDSGTVKEFEHPYILLQNPDGEFYKMVSETGRAMSEELKKIARQSYQKLHVVPEEKIE